jgi:hypothetical protein
MMKAMDSARGRLALVCRSQRRRSVGQRTQGFKCLLLPECKSPYLLGFDKLRLSRHARSTVRRSSMAGTPAKLTSTSAKGMVDT